MGFEVMPITVPFSILFPSHPGEPIVIPDLTPGKEYVLEIAALNEAGVGKTVFRTIRTPEG
jgi:hypothetical protein